MSIKVLEAWEKMSKSERKLIPVVFPLSTIEFNHKEICELMDLREKKLGKSPVWWKMSDLKKYRKQIGKNLNENIEKQISFIGFNRFSKRTEKFRDKQKRNNIRR